jgi:hypothetical protein
LRSSQTLFCALRLIPKFKNKRSSLHVTGNDAKFGLKVNSRDAELFSVNGLQYHYCISFGRLEKVGAKRKAKGNIQAWSDPFRYDNIEGRVRDQRTDKFEEYSKLDSQVLHPVDPYL